MDVPYSHFNDGLGRFYLGLPWPNAVHPVNQALLHGTVDSQPCVLSLDRTALALTVEGITLTDLPTVGSVLRNLCLDADATLKPYIATPWYLTRWQNMPAEKRDAATVAPRGPWTIRTLDDAMTATLPLEMAKYPEDHYARAVHDFFYDLPPEFGPAPTVVFHDGGTVVERRLILVDYQEAFLREFLNDQQRYVVIHRYGLRGSERRTRRDIADALGVGCARVADIEHTACRRMHHLTGEIQRSYAEELSDE